MAWNNDIAKEFKKRNNPFFKSYTVGECISPTVEYNADGTVSSLKGPLIVTAYDGQLTYTGSQLSKLSSVGIVSAGDKVLLLGDESPIILGVIE